MPVEVRYPRLSLLLNYSWYRLRGSGHSKVLDEWAYRCGVKLNFIRPGKPIENAYAESFIGRLRDECLNENWFVTLDHARELIENWRIDYNEGRPHTSLEGLTLREYVSINQEILTAVGL